VSDSSAVLRLSALFQAQVGRRAGRVVLGAFALALVVGAHLARVGTVPTRAVAAGAMVLVLAFGIARRVRERRAMMTPRGVIRRVLSPTEPKAAERALRAESLLRATEKDPESGSLELARLHFRRVLERVSPEAVERAGARRAARLSWALLALVTCTGFGVLFEPMRVVEGLDVLVARGGVAPLPLTWLSLVRVNVQPPAYLRSAEQAIFPALRSALPQGSVLTVRGIPEAQGRHLVLSDGRREVPFIEDGTGSVVARWTLDVGATLRVAARFGQVLVPEAEVLELIAVPDQAPQIELEDAPRAVQLRDVESVELRYVASDDHGLREVDLVLRSGGREERRTLVRLDGQARVERGAHALSVRDPFLRRMFLPVVATIEARDNDVVHGAKWGKSAAITILPPAIGEPQALRYRALADARDKLTDLLAFELGTERARREHSADAELRAREPQKASLKAEALGALRAAVSGSFSGARLSSGLTAFFLGQARVLEARSTDGRRRSEDALLALDQGLRALSARDAADVAKRLGDAAEEAADGAKLAIGGEKRRQGEARLEAALGALDSGSAHLVTLGALGADVGSVALGEIRRIRRARAAGSFSDAELAARHLAARLRRPMPSFSAGGGGGVESGRGAQGPGEASDADRQFDQMMRELEQLAEEHAEHIRSVERSLLDSEQGEGSEDLKREAVERAQKLRQRLAALPEPGAVPGSARAAAALGREHMSAMAQNLERLALKDAVENGRRSKSQVDEAGRLAREPRSPSDWLDDAAVSEAGRELEEQLAWAERALERQQQQASARAARDLQDAAGREEGLARRAGNLAGRAEHSEAKLPDDVQDSLERAENAMRQASRELGEGRGEQALELQREAQRLLERSNPGKTSDSDDNSGKQSGRGGEGGKDLETKGHVPAADKARRAEDFRRRVLQGLAKERRGRLSPAVERYAEGLLE
jgi:hypothetical protein